MRALLRGLTHDDPRGWGPIPAVVDAFGQTPEGREVVFEWHIQLLGDYANRPFAEWTRNYDLLVVNHTFIGEVAESGCFTSIAELPATYVGPSSRSCQWNGACHAYPLDATCYVCAYHPSRLRAVPQSWEQVFEVAENGVRVATPLAGEHALAALCTLLASIGAPLDPEAGFPDAAALQQVTELMKRLVEVSKRDILCWNSVHALDALAEGAIDFIPLTWANAGFQSRRVRFGEIPSFGSPPAMGAIFGGTGMAVSAACRYQEEAMAFARFVSSGEGQMSVWARNGGQPAHRDAWDLLSHSDLFYRDCRATIEASYLRPCFPGWNRFQAAAGDAICEWLGEPNRRISSLDSKLRRLWEEARKP